jgi:hypothetical protein
MRVSRTNPGRLNAHVDRTRKAISNATNSRTIKIYIIRLPLRIPV